MHLQETPIAGPATGASLKSGRPSGSQSAQGAPSRLDGSQCRPWPVAVGTLPQLHECATYAQGQQGFTVLHCQTALIHYLLTFTGINTVLFTSIYYLNIAVHNEVVTSVSVCPNSPLSQSGNPPPGPPERHRAPARPRRPVGVNEAYKLYVTIVIHVMDDAWRCAVRSASLWAERW